MASKKKLKRRIKKMQYKYHVEQYKRKKAQKAILFWQGIVDTQDEEIEQLKAPKVTVHINVEPVEVVDSDGSQ